MPDLSDALVRRQRLLGLTGFGPKISQTAEHAAHQLRREVWVIKTDLERIADPDSDPPAPLARAFGYGDQAVAGGPDLSPPPVGW